MANAVTTLKKVADTLALPTLAAKELLTLFNPQNKNLFEVIITPESLTLGAVAWSALDTAITTVYCQSLTFGMFGLEYERYNHEQGVKDIVYPEDITITFIDNEEAFVRLYLQKWMTDTVALRSWTGIPGDYVFSDEQNAAKKTMIIMPQMTTGAPSLCWIKINGARYKNMEVITMSQESGEPLILSVQLAVDSVQWYSPLTPLL